MTEHVGGTDADNSDAHRQMKVAHIPVAGDYTITTNAPESALRFDLDGKVIPFVSPRLSFGHDNPYGFLPWLFGGLCLVSCIFLTPMSGQRTASDAGQPMSVADTGVRSDLTAAEAAELEQRRQNWAAIDSLVREFIPEAIRRGTRDEGPFLQALACTAFSIQGRRQVHSTIDLSAHVRAAQKRTAQRASVAGRADQ